jgi:hypothetical protein
MNAAKTKFLTWLAAGALGVGLCVYVVFNLKRLQEVQVPVSTERMTEVLSDTPAIVEKSEDIIPYERVQAALISFDWPGKPPPPKTELVPEPELIKTTALPVKKLVKIMGYKVDGRHPEDSSVILKYLPDSKVPAPPSTGITPIGVLKHPGDTLDAPIDHIAVLRVTVDGVEFGFDDDEREPELLSTEDYPLEDRIVRVTDDGQIVTAEPSIFIPKGRTWSQAPKKTEFIGRNRYRVGTDDIQYIGENYPQILSEDVRTGRHKDPNTGRYDGIEIKSVSPGSTAARHGAQTGDVIKSINGHPVTSTQEAINFVKNNAEMYESWKVVVENKGQERTVTYYPPKE